MQQLAELTDHKAAIVLCGAQSRHFDQCQPCNSADGLLWSSFHLEQGMVHGCTTIQFFNLQTLNGRLD